MSFSLLLLFLFLLLLLFLLILLLIFFELVTNESIDDTPHSNDLRCFRIAFSFLSTSVLHNGHCTVDDNNDDDDKDDEDDDNDDKYDKLDTDDKAGEHNEEEDTDDDVENDENDEDEDEQPLVSVADTRDFDFCKSLRGTWRTALRKALCIAYTIQCGTT